MKIATGVEMIELQVEAFGGRTVLNPTLVWDDETAVLIDAGMPGSWESIRAAMSRAGIPADQLRAVILTHQDLDHIGSLPEILQERGSSVEVYAHELDKPYIEGTLPLFKTTPANMAKILETLPEGERQKALALFENPPKAKVDRTLADGDELPFCGGIRVVHTPGHTPGHICLYLKTSKTLVAGDAMIYMGGSLRGPVSQTTPDMDTALGSLKKLVNLEIESVICYHGGYCHDNVRDQLNQLLK